MMMVLKFEFEFLVEVCVLGSPESEEMVFKKCTFVFVPVCRAGEWRENDYISILSNNLHCVCQIGRNRFWKTIKTTTLHWHKLSQILLLNML